jgi:fengycin family lipopeptide synthetase B
MVMESTIADRKVRLSAAKQALLAKRLRGEAASHSRWQEIPRRTQQNFVPLSFAQQRLWLLDQLEPGNTAYNISRVFQFDGPLDSIALTKALNAIVARHESLRTSFTISDGQPVQAIAPAVKVHLKFTDLIDRGDMAQRDELLRLATEDARRGFSLTQCPLFRVHLLRLGAEKHLLLLTIHHIVSDAWSLEIFKRELSELYQAYCDDREPELSPVQIQYPDYAVWRRNWVGGGAVDEQIAYWRERLTPTPPALVLPTDKQRPQRLSFRGAHQAVSMPKRLSEQLQSLAQHEQATFFMIVLAAFNALLHRYTGADDIAVGTPVAGRNRVEAEPLIGFFVNTLVLRSDLSGNPTFRELLRRTRENTFAAYANREVPFELLVQEMRPPRGVGHSPFFQVMLDVHTLSENTSESDCWRTENFEIDRGGARADLLLFVEEAENSLDCWLEYSTDLFQPETISRMLRHFEILLEGIIDDPDRRISELPLLTPAERRQLLVEWNPTRTILAQDRCIHQVFEEQFEKSPEAVALVCGEAFLTYRELNERANRLAHHLRRRGVGPEVLVGICLDRSVEMIVGLLAIFKAGGAYVPLDPSYPTERLALMLADARLSILLTQEKLREKVEGLNAELIALDSDWGTISLESGENPSVSVNRANLAYVIYTSGSTGKPKGVLVTQDNLLRLFETTDRLFNFNSDDVWTLFHSYAFDFSVWEIWGALLYGGRLVIVPFLVSRSPDEFYELLCAERVTVLNQTPSAFRQLSSAGALQDELALRLIIFGGEALDLKSLKPWFDHYGDRRPQLMNMYGITETTVHVTYRPLREEDLEEGWRSPIGGPLDDLQVYILDRHQQLLPVGVAGEIYVGGAGLSRGYLHAPELTAERFVPHPFSDEPGARLYRTGDVARYWRNGDIDYLGRRDRQVKIRGFRIELGEIESVLTQHEDVRECLVLAGEEDNADVHLTAYLVGESNKEPHVEDVRAFAKERLPAHMAPAFFVTLDKFPLTPNGKIDQRALPLPDKARRDFATSFVAPRTETEKKLAEIWSNVLGRNEIGVNDNFFDLGGHSLLAAQMRLRVCEIFIIDIPLRCFFDKPTIAALAEFVERNINQRRETIPAIKRLPRD